MGSLDPSVLPPLRSRPCRPVRDDRLETPSGSLGKMTFRVAAIDPRLKAMLGECGSHGFSHAAGGHAECVDAPIGSTPSGGDDGCSVDIEHASEFRRPMTDSPERLTIERQNPYVPRQSTRHEFVDAGIDELAPPRRGALAVQFDLQHQGRPTAVAIEHRGQRGDLLTREAALKPPARIERTQLRPRSLVNSLTTAPDLAQRTVVVDDQDPIR